MSNLSQFLGGGIKSIQRGTISVTLNGSGIGSSTATITSVTTTKADISILGSNVTGGSYPSTFHSARISLTNGTTVTANVSGGPSETIVVGYQVVEYN